MKAICSISLFLLIAGGSYAHLPADTGRHVPYVYLQESIEKPVVYPNYYRVGAFNFLKIEYRMGYSNTAVRNLPESWTVNGKPTFGGGIGIILSTGNAGIFSAGINYQTAGLQVKENSIGTNERDNYLRLQYLKVPLQYQFYIDNSKKVFFGGGGYGAALLVPAVQKIQVFDEDDMSKFDAGLIASAGYWLSRKWMLQASAEFGMIDLNKSKSGMLGKINQYLLTISYAIPLYKRTYDQEESERF